MTTILDKNGVTITQRSILERIEPNVWFDPQDYKSLQSFTSRISACRQLADKNILLKRAYSDLGYATFQYMLPIGKAEELGLIKETQKNE